MMPLAMVRPGETVTLCEVTAGHELRRRLATLGLVEGTVVRVVQSDGGGPLIVAFRDDARLALGRGMAHKIRVRPASG
jgi:ferrous iron transport protein A